MYNRGGGSSDRPRGFGFTGFTLPTNKTSSEAQLAKLGFGMVGGIGMHSRGYGTGLGKRRIKSEEEYFDDDEEDKNDDLEYQPAPDSPTRDKGSKHDKPATADNDDVDTDASDDPLDAFMVEIQEEVVKQDVKSSKKPLKKKKGVRDDIDNEDVEESYYRYMEENPMAGVILDDDNQPLEYDEDGNVIIPDKNRIIDPLPPIDHWEIEYQKFNKNFYEEHPDIAKLSESEVQELRQALGIRVSGIQAAYKPVSSFAHFGFDNELIKAIQKMEFTQPTPVQAQGIPVTLSGRDMIGIAKTGSGKTAAFLWPLLVHIMAQGELKKGEGPIGLICAPTRELSQQIYHEAKRFGKIYNIKVVCAYGGGNMWEQCKACEEGAEIVVCTPGRLIDLVKKKATNLRRVTYLIFDEADRMFDMGFEPQVRSIANHVRPNRQTLLFSATFKRRVERVCRDILTDPVRVIQGDIGEANEDVTQIVKIVHDGPSKWRWVKARLVEFTSSGSVLIFVTRKANSVELADNLKANDFKVGLMHGDMDQNTRNQVITAFKKKEMPVLIATDVAARGLDINHIRTVVNYDVARDIDTHTHRVGRTGRAGQKGTAYTLVTPKDKEFAGHLVRNLEGANQFVPPELIDLAMQISWFKNSRYKEQKVRKLNIGGQGLGFRERPGLGAGTSSSTNSSSLTNSYKSFQPAGESAGPQSERISSLKTAFSAQYQMNFIKGQRDSSKIEFTNPSIDSDAPLKKRKKKSRWD